MAYVQDQNGGEGWGQKTSEAMEASRSLMEETSFYVVSSSILE